MHNPPERLNNEDLEKRLIHHVVEHLARGAKADVAHWIPDSDQKNKSQLSNTLATSLKALELADANAKQVCNYLLRLIGGFLQDSKERTYLAVGGLLANRSRVEFPTYTLDETTKCVTWLVDRRAASHEQRFAELIETHLGQEQYAPMWQAARVSVTYLTSTSRKSHEQSPTHNHLLSSG
jgi:hypothetical protein